MIATYTQDQINQIVIEAKQAAHEAAKKYFNEQLGGVDRFACGFAWVYIYGVKGNTKLGKMLKAAGITQDYTKAFQIWDPSNFGCQNVDTLKVGAIAAQDVFRQYGFDASAYSKLD